MRILLKPFHLLYVIYSFLLFFVLMIPVFIWALFSSLFGKIRGGNMVYYGCMAWADIWFPLIFIGHKNIFVERPRKDRSYIYVVNHISYLDSAILPKTFRHPVRPLGKVEMARIPIFGTIYKNAIVTVDRSSAINRARSVTVLKSILRKGISILVFPEGTFNTSDKPLKDFYDGAFRIAIETGTPIKPVLFLHTYDRMHYNSVTSLTPGKSRSIFLPEIPVKGLTLKDVGELKTKVYDIMAEELRKRGASWIKE
jgi:1-acyl-sn-glycerol-3-phosphate acyltransferase